MLRSVLLPQPLGPVTAMVSPGRMERETSLRTCWTGAPGADWKSRETLVRMAMGALTVGSASGLDEFREFAEEVAGVVGAWGGFRVVLDGEDRGVAVAEAFDGLVIEIDVGDLDVGGEGVGVDGEAVVLAGDGDRAGAEVFDGLVAAAVAEGEFKGFSAEGVAEDLVAEADGEDGFTAEELADLVVDVVEGGWVAGAVGEEDAVGVEGEDIGGGGAGVDDLDGEAFLAETAEDVEFDAEVEGDDFVLGGDEDRVWAALAVGEDPFAAEGVIGVPRVVGGGGDLADEVAAGHGWAGGGASGGFGGIEDFGAEEGAHGTAGAEVAGEPAGIDAFDAEEVPFFEVVVETHGGAPIAWGAAEFADDEAADVGLEAFVVFRGDAVVADERVGHGDDLAAVRGVGEDLLVTGHGGIEAGFTGG